VTFTSSGSRRRSKPTALGALDTVELVVMPFLLGDGMRLTPALSTDAALTLERERPLPGGSVEVVYSVGKPS
jgi:hypothetical protein